MEDIRNVFDMILDCGHFPSKDVGAGTGIGNYFDGNGVERTCCYVCAAERELAEMNSLGRTTLYLTLDNTGHGTVSNWTGLISYRVAQSRIGNHNIVKNRYDVWFRDEAGNTWWGVTYGDDTQICHCTRLKNKKAA